jgi:hypothetical protein
MIFDNFEKIEVKPKFLNSILNIKNSLKINFNIAFIGTNIPNNIFI